MKNNTCLPDRAWIRNTQRPEHLSHAFNYDCLFKTSSRWSNACSHIDEQVNKPNNSELNHHNIDTLSSRCKSETLSL